MSDLIHDLRHGLRLLRKNPGFSLVAVLTLALGIGASTAIFSAIDALLLRPIPVEEPDRLVFGMALREGFDPFGTSLLEYDLYHREARSLAGSGLGTPRLFHLVGSGEPERLRGSAVTASYLSTLGVRPVQGRLFRPEEDRPGGPAVALIGHDLWRRRFGGDPEIIGRTLDLEGSARTIVGILPPGFDLPYSAEVWVPMQVAIDSLPIDQRAATANELVARLKPGVGLDRAGAELRALAGRLEREYPNIRKGWSFGIVPLRWQLLADLEGRTHRSLGILGFAVGVLVLICCVNVANLLLARGVTREGEIGIRMSLGAGRGRIVRQLMTESLLLGVLGGGAGVLLAFWALPLLTALNPVRAVGLAAYLGDFRIDDRVLLFSLGATLLTGILFGLAPAHRTARLSDLAAVLNRGGQRAGVGGRGRRFLGMLVILEVALAATLLAGGGLTVKSLQRLHRIDLGFRPDHLLTLELPLSAQKYPGTEAQARFGRQVSERVRSLPGVTAAGTTTNLPLQWGVTLDSVFEAEGRPPSRPSEVPITGHRLVSPGYLETLRPTLREGRLLDERDHAGTEPVAVISEEFARQIWPGESPLGKRVRRVRTGERGPWMTVVGVVRDVKEDRISFRTNRPVWYLPHDQQTAPLPVGLPLNLVVRTKGDPTSIAPAVREAIHAVDPDQPVANVMTMEESLSDVLTVERFGAVLMGTLAALGLVLSAFGLYGVMAYSVSRRTGEIGLRMALGARPKDVLRLILGQGASLLLLGLAVGVLGIWAISRMLAGMLYQVSPGDPPTLLIVPLVLTGAALLACYLPARRASRVDPMSALRSE